MESVPRGRKAASGKTNPWVDPSFSELPGANFFLPPAKRKVPATKDGAKRTRKKRPEDDKKVQRGTSHPSGAGPRDQDDVPWVDRHAPQSQAELAVHKKKIEEVENWMRVHTKSSKGGILLLTGPSGCGKTATVQVLSQELGFRVQEWINPTNTEPYSSGQQQEWRTHNVPFSSQLSLFQDFLLRANKYRCLRMVGDGGGASDRKLILVEDMPNLFYRQPESLHDNLRRFAKSSRCPLVFVVSDGQSGDSSSRLLFPKEIQEELDICSISFNPVAPTTMIKVLTRIATLEAGQSCGRICVPDKSVLDLLCSGSSGDVRSAVNSLQFSSLPDTSLEKELWRTKKEPRSLPRSNQRKRRSKRTKEAQERQEAAADEEEEGQAIGGKDAALFLFRALGKILHCKRGTLETGSGPGPALPSHLRQHHRESLLVNPELVVERSHMSGDFFNLYLHQNYVDFFSQVEDVAQASEYLSDADFLTADWTSRSTMMDYGSSVATRGLLHSNTQQASVGFRPLHKPGWLLISKKHRDNSRAAQSLFRNFCLTPVSLQTELLPYLAKLSSPMRNQAQIAFIQDVGQMPLRSFSCRLKPEALTDKEPAQLESDGEEGHQGHKEEGPAGAEEVPTSQPQPNANQALMEEEEELLIEEYLSD